MTEFEYPECTTSVITGLAIFKKRYPTYRNQEIDAVTAKAIKYLHNYAVLPRWLVRIVGYLLHLCDHVCIGELVTCWRDILY
jgi:hypothetical protein